MKLISCTDFVIEECNKKITVPKSDKSKIEICLDTLIRIEKYAEFLKQPLTLGMFVPAKLVNGEWVVLEEPIWHDEWLKGKVSTSLFEHCRKSQEYQEAKDRVLFEGFCFNSHFDFVTNGKISFDKNDMPNILIEKLTESELVLTESAKKQILGS